MSLRFRELSLHALGVFDHATFRIPEADVEGTKLILFEGPNGAGKTTVLEAIAHFLGMNGATDMVIRGYIPQDAEAIRGTFFNLGKAPAVLANFPAAFPPMGHYHRWAPGYVAKLSLKSGMRALDLAEDDERRMLPPDGVGDADAPRAEFQNSAATDAPTAFAAFAFRGNLPTARLATDGPRDFTRPALVGALSFGEIAPASEELGQALVNFDYERKSAIVGELEGPSSEKESHRRRAQARTDTLCRFKEAASKLLDRKVDIHFDVPNKHTPRITFDGRDVPLELLGEGLRRTFAWLSDLVVRLERTPWRDAARDPFQQDFWLLLDEIDQSLHPQLQRRILPVLRELFPNAVILASTHSPFVVSSATEGYVFALRPDRETGRVSGPQEAQKLIPGQSLAWAAEEIFGVSATFQDPATVENLRAHKLLVDRVRVGRDDATALAELRQLRALLLKDAGDELRTVVAIREAPIRNLLEAPEAAE